MPVPKAYASGFNAPIDFQYVVGDCLFDSLSYLLRRLGVVLSSLQLRQLAMDTLDELYIIAPRVKSQVDYRLSELHIDFDTYKARMRTPAMVGNGLWGDNLCLTALSFAFKCFITTWDAQTRVRLVQYNFEDNIRQHLQHNVIILPFTTQC